MEIKEKKVVVEHVGKGVRRRRRTPGPERPRRE
jgi:hypothetical protein